MLLLPNCFTISMEYNKPLDSMLYQKGWIEYNQKLKVGFLIKFRCHYQTIAFILMVRASIHFKEG